MEKEKIHEDNNKEKKPNIPSVVSTVNKFTYSRTVMQLATEKLTLPVGLMEHCRQNYKSGLTCKYRNPAKLLLVLNPACIRRHNS